jgi:hypothetical protein
LAARCGRSGDLDSLCTAFPVALVPSALGRLRGVACVVLGFHLSRTQSGVPHPNPGGALRETVDAGPHFFNCGAGTRHRSGAPSPARCLSASCRQGLSGATLAHPRPADLIVMGERRDVEVGDLSPGGCSKHERRIGRRRAARLRSTSQGCSVAGGKPPRRARLQWVEASPPPIGAGAPQLERQRKESARSPVLRTEPERAWGRERGGCRVSPSARGEEIRTGERAACVLVATLEQRFGTGISVRAPVGPRADRVRRCKFLPSGGVVRSEGPIARESAC